MKCGFSTDGEYTDVTYSNDLINMSCDADVSVCKIHGVRVDQIMQDHLICEEGEEEEKVDKELRTRYIFLMLFKNSRCQ
jgi:hypothetical protein